ncbi:hypothetical protein LshimejAT787_1900050 [Lyophyllum shimeji]|uniref:Uncharacterized protein n=1 Tax=Lyophyllum shimeji TaxID=47721 RepID=A0A9P3Q158_LYOSH|nr:hypothetical protein LshimejAT787_1900050 [Lyophyllum shimeji]
MAYNETDNTISSELFSYDPEDRRVVFKYDGFITPSLIGRLGIHLASSPITLPASFTSRPLALCNFEISFPKLPIHVQAAVFADCIVETPNHACGQGKYGPTFTIGIKAGVLDKFMTVARKEGYTLSSEIPLVNGYYWINTTTDTTRSDLMSVLSSETDENGVERIMQFSLPEPAANLASLKDKNGNRVNVIGYATLDLKLKTYVPDDKLSLALPESRKKLRWVISARMYRYYIKRFTKIGPSQSVAPEFAIDPRMHADDDLVENFRPMFETEEEMD